MKMRSLIHSVVSAVVVAGASGAHAADYWVSPGGTGDYSAGNPGPSPVAAANLARQPGDVIHLATGTYTMTDYASAYCHVDLAAGVTLIGGSDKAEETELIADKRRRVIVVGEGAVVRNLTASNGYTDYQAGGICGDRIDYVVSNCVVQGCSGLYKGGGACCGTWYDSVIRNCLVRNQSYGSELQQGTGGGIYGGTLYRCVITNNAAAYAGGGVGGGPNGGTGDRWICRAYDCLIANNSAPYGAGAATVASAGYCTLYGCTVENNVARNPAGQTWGGMGGGVYGAYVTNSVIRGNVTVMGVNGSGGGGVSHALVVDSELSGNVANVDGATWKYSDGGAAADSHLTGCRMLGNRSSLNGGATIGGTNVNCVIAGNTAMRAGGCISSFCENCIITNNVATDYEGGATYNSTTYNCWVAFNRTEKYPGTHYLGYHQGDVIVSNSCGFTMWGSAVTSTSSAYEAAAVNCTIVGNSGGEAQCYVLYMTNCIVVGSSSDVAWAHASHSLWQTGLGEGSSGSRDACLVGPEYDPQFVVDAGDRQCAYSLKDSSPCVGKGLNFDWMVGAKDILGNDRLFRHDKTVDIGACECWWRPGLLIIGR